jgi:site-specific recombinase XerD
MQWRFPGKAYVKLHQELMTDQANPNRPPPANKGRRLPPEVLTEAEVSALLRACSNRAPTGVRNRALIVLMYRGGLRVGEALALRPKDLDRAAGTIRVLHGKGDKARTVGLDPQAFAVLERWLDRRAARGINGHAPIFCTLKGEPVSSSYVRVLLPRLAKKAGIVKRVHPHGLRHTHAAELAREGVPARLIQEQLGHSSLATTDVYLRKLAPQDLIDAMQKRSWKP